MPRSVVSDSLKRDRELRRLYYRPYVKYGALLLVFMLALGIHTAWWNRRTDTEWKNVPLQQGVATCMRSYTISDHIEQWWMNTYLIRGEKHLVQRREGCLAGREYRVYYRIGRSGQLEVGSQIELVSPGKR